MKKLFNRLAYACAIFLMVLPLVSCGGGGGGTVSTGTLDISLTDASNGDYQAVYITIDEIQVKKQGADEGEAGWETFAPINKTYDLLKLMNGVMVPLGVGELEAGQYGQIRLILGELPAVPNPPEEPDVNICGVQHPFANYLIKAGDCSTAELAAGLTEELKVPSGYQTGIKIVKGFTIVASGNTELILDFDAHRSIVKAGSIGGKWLLKPTIKVLEVVEGLENSISGTVTYASNTVEGAKVSAQIFTPLPDEPAPDDIRDEVIVESKTVSEVIQEETYNYLFHLTPDIYNIVVLADGYQLACQEVEAFYYEPYTANFELMEVVVEPPPEPIEISGIISGLTTDTDTAYLSIRKKNVDCGGAGPVTIEVASAQPVNGSYSIIVPAGTYDLVATDGTTTKVFAGLDANTEQDIDFTPAP